MFGTIDSFAKKHYNLIVYTFPIILLHRPEFSLRKLWLFLLKTFVHHTSYSCMDWFTNAKCSAHIVSTTFILNSPLYFFVVFPLAYKNTPFPKQYTILSNKWGAVHGGAPFYSLICLSAQASEREKAFFILQLSSKSTLFSVSAARAFSSLAMASLASVRRAARRAGSASWACFSS